MIPHGKIGGHAELVGEMFQHAIGLWVVIVDEISGKNDKGWRWVDVADLGDSAAECCIGIDAMRLLACVSHDVRVRQLNKIPRFLHKTLFKAWVAGAVHGVRGRLVTTAVSAAAVG